MTSQARPASSQVGTPSNIRVVAPFAGAVDDIAVPRNPAHVGGAPVDFPLPIVKDVAESHGRHEQVAPGGVEHSFGFPVEPEV